MLKFKIFLFFVLVTLSGISVGQVASHVKWKYSTKQLPDNTVELIFTASIDAGWHLYSPYNPPGASKPLEILFNKNAGYQLLGKIIEKQKPKEKFEEIFNVTEKFFEGSAVFSHKIKLVTNKPVTISGTVEGQVCFEDGMCIAFEDDFSFNVVPEIVTPVKTTDTSVANTLNTSDTLPKDSSLVAVTDSGNVTGSDSLTTIKETEYQITDPGIFNTSSGIWSIFWISFIAGLIAIITPCVFPMIPMTVSFFIKEQDKSRGKFLAGFFGLSIILIYTLPIALLIVISKLFGQGTVTADIFNWMSTHWLPNIIFFLIFIVFAASFLGMFEIVLPSWMVNKADSKSEKGGLVGVFFMAFVLVLVSFSCTGPIVGTVLVQSTAGAQIAEPIVAMLGFSLAFALPFTLFALFPAWLNKLPKSGGWLNSVKVVLGFLELALGLKFLSVADQTYHWGILDREIYIAAWIVIFALLGFYLLGKLKFAHDSDTPYIKVPKLALAIITFSFVVYLIPGMFGAPLKALSGYLPPQSSHDFDMRQIVRDVVNEEIKNNDNTAQSAINGATLCDQPKYSSFLHLPHGIEGYFDYEQGIACAKKLNKPVFIDFTGHGCVNCRKMEEIVWVDPEVLKRLKNDYVVIALYVDDKSELPENEWVTSKVDTKVKKTIGKKFADFQVSRFGVNAQPYYVILDPFNDLKPLVTPRAYNLDVKAFINFLDEGVANFKKQNNNK